MATAFRNKVIKNVGKVPVEIYTTDANTRSTIIGMSLTNLTNSFVYVSVHLQDDTSVEGFFLKDSLLAANTSIRAVNTGEKLIMAPNNKLLVSSSANDSVDVILSFVDII